MPIHKIRKVSNELKKRYSDPMGNAKRNLKKISKKISDSSTGRQFKKDFKKGKKKLKKIRKSIKRVKRGLNPFDQIKKY